MKIDWKSALVKIIAICLLGLIILVSLPYKVTLICCLLVLLDKCFLARVRIVGIPEFTTLATLLITLKYGLIGGFFLSTFMIFAPGLINVLIGEKWVVSPDFKPISFDFGNIKDFICVVIIHYLRNFDLLVIMLVVTLFKTLVKIEGFKPTDTFSIPLTIGFNLILVYLLRDFILSLI